MALPVVDWNSIAKLAERASPRLMVAVCLASGALLLFGSRLSPDAARFAHDHVAWIWATFLLSAFFSVTFPIQRAAGLIQRWDAKRKENHRVFERLQSLSIGEKHLLQYHMENPSGVMTWSVNRSEVIALVHDRVLVLLVQRGVIGYLKLTNNARKLLQDNPALIATPDNLRPPRTRYEWMV